MHYVVIRDDDTNALTPPEYLERLYRPFLDRGMPVNLAVIPAVRTNVRKPDGGLEGFLCTRPSDISETAPIYTSPRLLSYLFNNPLYRFAQHGLHHDYFEFDSNDRADVDQRLDRGTRILLDAGFPQPRAFVAPYDKFSRTSLAAAAARFDVVSSGWFEHRRLPLPWWPRFLWKKLARAPHWRIRGATLLTHPGCLLSCYRCHETMIEEVKGAVRRNQLTVLVTHWWEYFRNGTPDEEFIRILHQAADWLASQQDVRVISFEDIASHPRRYVKMMSSPAFGSGTAVPTPSPTA
jgi:hypothetical protein